MKLHGDVKVGKKVYKKGSDLPAKQIYPFFMIHMLMFGLSGFVMAYSSRRPDIAFLYLHGGFAIFVYTIFYLTIFGVDEVKWMFINAALGILGIYSQIDWILYLFGKDLSDFPIKVHVIPFLYFILYTFLLRQAIIDFTGSRENEARKRKVEYGYVGLSVVIYLGSFMLHDASPPTSDAENTVRRKTGIVTPAEVYTHKGDHAGDEIMETLRNADRYWDKRDYAEAYKYYRQAYDAAFALDYFDDSRNRKLAFSSSGVMATACMLGKWEEADRAMGELKQRYHDLKPENRKKMDYWIETGEPRLKRRQC